MCGNIVFSSRCDVSERTLEGLSLLEYSGYDSAGLALIEPDSRVNLRRSVGKLSELRATIKGVQFPAALALGIHAGRPLDPQSRPFCIHIRPATSLSFTTASSRTTPN